MELGADIAVLSETRIAGPLQHSAASAGMSSGGFLCISHNVPPLLNGPSGHDDPRSAGVALAVRRNYAGDWSRVTYGPAG